MPAEKSYGVGALSRSVLIAVYCSICGPIAMAYALMYHFSSNLPVLDDYGAVLNFSLHFLSLTTFRDKFFTSPARNITTTS